MKKAYLDTIKEYIDENPTLNNTELADLIVEDDVIPKSHRTIRRYIGNYHTSLATATAPTPSADTDTDVEDTKPEPVEEQEEGYYYIDYASQTYKISEELVDEIFCAYSRKGLNYSRPQVIDTLDIPNDQFNAITARLNLSKESEALGPKSCTLPEEDKYDRVVAISESLMPRFKESDSGTLEALVRDYKRKLIEVQSFKMERESRLNAVLDKLPKINLDPLPFTSRPVRTGVLYLVLTDLHIGMETDRFNFAIAKKKFGEIATEVNHRVKQGSYGEVVLIVLGDLPHTVSGLNHANSWKDIESGSWGADALIKPFELLAQLVAAIPTVSSIYGVGGNHGRLHSSKEVEPTDEGEKLIFYMLDQVTADHIKVVFDSDKVIFSKGQLTFICLHGDQGLDKKSGQEIAWLHGRPDTYNMVLLGHTHSRQIGKHDDGYNFRKMVCPSFCPTDDYANRLGLVSIPGFIMIEESMDGYPIVHDIPLKY